MTRKYSLPDCLIGRCTPAVYERWLQRKATAHQRRDRERGNRDCTVAIYKAAIHAAIHRNGDRDFYTGEPLRWDLISQYDNEASQARGRHYKREFADLPTVDHLGDGLGPARFVICAWRTNDAKNDLSYPEFISLCRNLLAWHEQHGADILAQTE